MLSSPAAKVRREAPGRELTQLAAVVLTVVALSMLSYRFAHISLSSFIFDEPAKLEMAQLQLKTGTWAASEPATGSVGVVYGPTSLWFYRVVQQAFGPNPRYSILAVAVLASITHVALAWALTDLFTGGLLLFALLTGLLAASPYQFFWARSAWEFGANLGSAWLVVLMTRPASGWRAWVVGIVMGFMISAHLMVLPWIALCFGLLLLERWPAPLRMLQTALAMLVPIVVINIPYLMALRALEPRSSASSGLHFHGSPEQLLLAPRLSTTWRIQYFFDGAWGDFRGSLGGMARLLDASLAWTIVLAVITAAGLTAVLWSGSQRQRQLAFLALAAWLGYAAFYSLAPLDLQHPHYLWPVSWICVVGLAAAVSWTQQRARRASQVLQGIVALVVGLQFLFIVACIDYTKTHTGTRGIHLSTPLGEQVRAVREICSKPGDELVIQNDTILFKESLRYLISINKRCAGRKVELCEHRCRAGKRRKVTVSYAGAEGGALRVD